jgi:Flp pilus assembly protein TadG
MKNQRPNKSRDNRFTRASESGQSMLELAVCLPIFALLILGTAEIANIAWASIQLNNAAHAGAQFGSHSRGFASQIGDIETAAQNEAPKLTITFPTDPSQTCSCIDPSTGAPATSGTTGCQTLVECPSPYIIMDAITVTTQAVVRPLVHYPGLPASYTLNATATMGVVN